MLPVKHSTKCFVTVHFSPRNAPITPTFSTTGGCPFWTPSPAFPRWGVRSYSADMWKRFDNSRSSRPCQVRFAPKADVWLIWHLGQRIHARELRRMIIAHDDRYPGNSLAAYKTECDLRLAASRHYSCNAGLNEIQKFDGPIRPL
jgi:hypothetical protein